MSTQYTPGPWPRTAGQVVISRVDGDGNETLTGYDFCAFPGDEEGIANARLVEAGTILLPQLEWAADQLEALGSDVSALRATIAQAKGTPTGETP